MQNLRAMDSLHDGPSWTEQVNEVLANLTIERKGINSEVGQSMLHMLQEGSGQCDSEFSRIVSLTQL